MHGGGRVSESSEPALVAAARAGELLRVKRLLEENEEYEELTAAFAAAVRAFHGHVADLLLMAGADAGRCAPEDLVSLREAVDSGSPALVGVLLDNRLRHRYPASELREARDLARRWHETGTEAELRRRTGSRDDPVRTRVQDDEYYMVGEFTLAGLTVRDGHGAILTDLEELLGIRASCGELLARAGEHDLDHAAWGRAAIVLAHRRDEETWQAAEALRTDADASRRLLGADVMRLIELFAEDREEEFCVLAVDTLTDWSAAETDSRVLATVLLGLGSYAGPRAEAALLKHARHHDADVRRVVAAGLGRLPDKAHLSDGARDALLTLMTDPEPDVRIDACRRAGEEGQGVPALADAMAALLDHPERRVQLAAVHGLALHADERCVQAATRLGPPRPGSRSEELGCFEAAWRYRWRRDDDSYQPTEACDQRSL